MQEVVGVGPRIGAILIDTVVLWIVAIFIGIVFGQYQEAAMINLTGLPAFLMLVIGFGYFIYLEGTKGQTLGKMAFGIKVVRENGENLDLGSSAVRNIIRIIDAFPFYLIGFIAILVSKKNQRLGDMAAKTIVVKA